MVLQRQCERNDCAKSNMRINENCTAVAVEWQAHRFEVSVTSFCPWDSWHPGQQEAINVKIHLPLWMNCSTCVRNQVQLCDLGKIMGRGKPAQPAHAPSVSLQRMLGAAFG